MGKRKAWIVYKHVKISKTQEMLSKLVGLKKKTKSNSDNCYSHLIFPLTWQKLQSACTQQVYLLALCTAIAFKQPKNKSKMEKQSIEIQRHGSIFLCHFPILPSIYKYHILPEQKQHNPLNSGAKII